MPASKHPGVWIHQHRARPGAKPIPQARWIDPVTGKRRSESLRGLSKADQVARCVVISEDLADAQAEQRRTRRRRGMRLEAQADVTLEVAFRQVIESHGGKERTIEELRRSADAMLEWAADREIVNANEVYRADFDAFRQWLVTRPKQRRRADDPEGATLSPAAINRDVRGLRTLWRRIIAREWAAPGLTNEVVKDALEKAKEKRKTPVMLTGEQYQKLLSAALKIRPEVAAFTTWMVVSGARVGEGMALTWGQIDLPNRRVGAYAEKTDTPRLVSLRVSPGMAAIFEAMKPADLEAAADDRLFRPDTGRDTNWSLRVWRQQIVEHGGPAVTWQELRQSCASWLACVDGIFGDVAHAMGLAQLGHTFATAARYYLSHDRSLTQASSLDEAWGCEAVLKEIAAAFG